MACLYSSQTQTKGWPEGAQCSFSGKDCSTIICPFKEMKNILRESSLTFEDSEFVQRK